MPTATPQPTEMPEEQSNEEQQPKQKKKTDAFLTLIVNDNEIQIAKGVDEKTLEKSPGWLETSAFPGEEGTCVIYGHRNRNHLKVLKDVKVGDTISIRTESQKIDYKIQSITILEKGEELSIPTTPNGSYLMLATCYPFYYSGHAPQQCVVTALFIT